jgi:hypothetical protein
MPDRVEFMATDSYTIGQDWADLESGPDKPVEVWIHQEAAKAIEATARRDTVPKTRAPMSCPDGRGRGLFTLHQGDALTFTPQLQGMPTSARDETGAVKPAFSPAGITTPGKLWQACDDLLKPLEADEGDPVPDRVMFDPTLLGRFGKVRAPSKELALMDLLFTDASNVTLVKIGSRFRGAIMAIDRPRAAKNPQMEQDALW